MNDLETVVATSANWQRVHDLLLIEKMILATMEPQEPETRGHVIAQLARVQALAKAEQVLAGRLAA